AVLLTVEDGAEGGFGAFVMHHLARNGLLDTVRVRPMTLPDRFIDHNTQDAQYREAGLDAQAIAACARNALGVATSQQTA
ncbi:transketolase C-terminal domain-containing protein, partial [Nguyenibacter vanlangensis]